MANIVDPDEDFRAVSAGSRLFAKVSLLVCRDERLKLVFVYVILNAKSKLLQEIVLVKVGDLAETAISILCLL